MTESNFKHQGQRVTYSDDERKGDTIFLAFQFLLRCSPNQKLVLLRNLSVGVGVFSSTPEERISFFPFFKATFIDFFFQIRLKISFSNSKVFFSFLPTYSGRGGGRPCFFGVRYATLKACM